MAHTVHTVLPKKADREKRFASTLTTVTGNLSADKAGLVKTHQLKDDDNQAMAQAPQVKPVPTSTVNELGLLIASVIPLIDVSASIENTNTLAKADVVVDGDVLLEQIPVTVLMPLKKQLSKLLPALSGIKALDRATTWVEATGQEFDKVYVTANPTTTDQTVTVKRWETIVPATQHHPAQTREIEFKNLVGQYTTTIFSGNMRQIDKTTLVNRLTTLITAVESAIQTANSSTGIVELPIGEILMKHIFGDL